MSKMKLRPRSHAVFALALACACAQTSTDAAAPAGPTDQPAGAEQGASADLGALLQDAIAGSHRKEGNAARDQWRHPAETLSFFGLQPSMTVVELWPGGGWYTELLAPTLAAEGKLVVTNYDPSSANEYRARSGKRFLELLQSNPEVFGKVEVRVIDPPEKMDFGPEGSADMVVTFRNSHGWVGGGYEAKALASVHKVLKPGGTFGVVQHRAKAGADPKKSAEKGYVPEAYLIEQAEKAGFKLVEKSEINANPKDTTDHPNGVWNLPPSLNVVPKGPDGKTPEKIDDAKKAELEEKFKAIGESDRMTLKFQKPA